MIFADMISSSIRSLVCVLLVSALTGLAGAQAASLKYDEVNGRVGPSTEHKVKWRYEKTGLPVRVLRATEEWSLISDPLGGEAWVHNRMISQRQTAYVAPRAVDAAQAAAGDIFNEPSQMATRIARAQAGVVLDVVQCAGGWRKVRADGLTGWMRSEELWAGAPCGPS